MIQRNKFYLRAERLAETLRQRQAAQSARRRERAVRDRDNRRQNAGRKLTWRIRYWVRSNDGSPLWALAWEMEPHADKDKLRKVYEGLKQRLADDPMIRVEGGWPTTFVYWLGKREES